MNRFKLAITFCCLVPSLMYSGCKEDPVIIQSQCKLTPLELSQPLFYPQLIASQQNPLTEEGVALGRKLYYDTLLSKGGPHSGKACATCHIQSKSFSLNTSGTAIIPHVNLAWKTHFLWNGAIDQGLEEAMMFEVNTFFNADVSHLQKTKTYPSLYLCAFGDSIVSVENTANALAQFLRSMTATNSRYDRYLRGQGQLTTSEKDGMNIFLSEKGDCFHCHTIPLLHDNEFHNIGLEDEFNSSNWGRYAVTNDSNDIGKFMTPTLRNIELTAPYMHDGRYATLMDVVEHYNTKVKISNFVDPILTKNNKENGLQLSEDDKQDLVAFLKSFTDQSFISNPDFSAP